MKAERLTLERFKMYMPLAGHCLKRKMEIVEMELLTRLLIINTLICEWVIILGNIHHW
jgi:hypothetical protein